MFKVEGTKPEIHILVLTAHPATVVEGTHLQLNSLRPEQIGHGTGTH